MGDFILALYVVYIALSTLQGLYNGQKYKIHQSIKTMALFSLCWFGFLIAKAANFQKKNI